MFGVTLEVWVEFSDNSNNNNECLHIYRYHLPRLRYNQYL